MIDELIQKYGTRGLFIDSNILLLLFVGSYDRRLITKYKRLSTFDQNSFEVLVKIVALFSKLITTPNVLTEVSNLSNQLPIENMQSYFQRFSTLLINLEEQYISSHELSIRTDFPRFGLTDSSIIHI
ncbi:hypothetical protein GKIL_1138 [Gloeobacter kilaueensis JS1]|uniref:PIN domain-containing protein n=1 Tax=Gloeobacter kilaueensis (strain ATCC BAA-2537 / CCAP 1431/1 / ULC 316 / JS1) TaxID=1183438 RepID=U5QIG4_GLOK1|nr:hypothetical protein GKIL_1138 [Gloeobacter kilaueensis JS1]